jgi:threonine aldolase
MRHGVFVPLWLPECHRAILGPGMIVDLRSDTVTKPTAGMRQAMANAEVGDDVFGEDPTINALEERLAKLFSHEAALFFPSGTMANQAAIKAHTRHGDEVICDEGAHIYRYEGGGTMATSGCSVKLIQGDRGRFTAAQAEEAINDPGNVHLPMTRLVSIENTCNRGGGCLWELGEVKRLKQLCTIHGLALHMDGARIFNALAVTNEKPSDWGSHLDSISVCLSKGLGTPAGSVLIGSTAFIREARRVRKRLGGGMRQTGILAAAGLYALDHHVARLPEDHARAKRIEAALLPLPFTDSVLPVATNIVIAVLRDGLTAEGLVSALRKQGVLISAIGSRAVRFVTHLDVDDDAIRHVESALNSIPA